MDFIDFIFCQEINKYLNKNFDYLYCKYKIISAISLAKKFANVEKKIDDLDFEKISSVGL